MPWRVVEYQDPEGDIMVARVPPEGTAELISGSQLIVQDGQVAVFYHDGRPTDVFRAGRYNLSTQNLPVLSKLLRLATMSESPFRSYLYFLALKTFTDLGWGTSNPILFRDTEFRMVNLRANGAFAVKLKNLKLFLQTIVGTQGIERTFQLQEYLRKIIVSKVAQTLPKYMETILDLPQHYEEICVQVKKATREEFAQYGVELVDLLVEAITMPKEVQEAINRATGVRAVGQDEAGHYERIARSDALRDAAKQPGSDAAAGLSAGLGIGAGVQVAREMMPPAAPPGAGPPPAPTPSNEPQKLTVDQVKTKLAELKGLVADGLITEADFDEQKKRLLAQM